MEEIEPMKYDYDKIYQIVKDKVYKRLLEQKLVEPGDLVDLEHTLEMKLINDAYPLFLIHFRTKAMADYAHRYHFYLFGHYGMGEIVSDGNVTDKKHRLSLEDAHQKCINSLEHDLKKIR
jgi:hypothetical protein